MKKAVWQHIDEIAQQQAEKLPLVFGKWEFYADKGLQSLILKNLRKVMKATWAFMTGTEWSGRPASVYLANTLKKPAIKRIVPIRISWEERPQAFEADLNDAILQVSYLIEHEPDEENKKYLQTLREDPDLNDYISLYIKLFEEYHRKPLTNVLAWKKWWESLEKRDQV